MKKITLALLLLSPTLALAQGLWVHHTIEDEFDTIKEYLEQGITNQGLVVAHRSDVGGMLQRTGADLIEQVESATHSVVDIATSAIGMKNPLGERPQPQPAPHSTFRRAEVIEFCSAKLSRQMTTIDPANLIFCPYSIALYTTTDAPEQVHLSYLRLSEIGAPASREVLQEVERMLAAIVAEALE